MKLLKVAMLTVMFGGAAAAQTPGVTDSTITLGAVLPMSGPAGLTGLGAAAGLKMAVEEANEAGGINGRMARLALEDDAYVPSRAYQGLVKLIDDGVFAVVGTSGAASLAAMLPLIDEQKIPTLVVTSVSRAAVNPVRPNVFMLGADYEDLFFAQIKYISEHEKPEGPYAVIRQDDDYGALVEDGFTMAVEQLGLPSVPAVRFKRGQKDFSAEVLRLRSQKIGSLSVGGVIAETPAVLKELAKMRMDIPTSNPHTGAIEMTLRLAAPYGMSYYAADYVAPLSSPAAAGFRALAEKTLSEDERKTLNRFSVASYLGAKAVLAAAEMCGRELTQTCLSEKIKSITDMDTGGLSAPLDFSNDKNTAARSVQVFHVNPMENKVEPVTDFISYR